MRASYAWLILLIIVAGYVTVFDVAAVLTHHPTMTGQMQTWLRDEVIGPFIIAAWVGTFTGLMYHFFVKGTK